MPRTQIFQLGEDISVVTDAIEERDFLDGFAEAVGGLKARRWLEALLADDDFPEPDDWLRDALKEHFMSASPEALIP